jgi:hypothetical protein
MRAAVKIGAVKQYSGLHRSCVRTLNRRQRRSSGRELSLALATAGASAKTQIADGNFSPKSTVKSVHALKAVIYELNTTITALQSWISSRVCLRCKCSSTLVLALRKNAIINGRLGPVYRTSFSTGGYRRLTPRFLPVKYFRRNSETRCSHSLCN